MSPSRCEATVALSRCVIMRLASCPHSAQSGRYWISAVTIIILLLLLVRMVMFMVNDSQVWSNYMVYRASCVARERRYQSWLGNLALCCIALGLAVHFFLLQQLEHISWLMVCLLPLSLVFIPLCHGPCPHPCSLYDTTG